MDCPSCQQSLPGDAAFCGHCGKSLIAERNCGGCGRSNPPEMRFCLGCGTPMGKVEHAAPPTRDLRDYTPRHLADKILHSKSALEGECKQVTVLFADVKSSMELQQDIDPEKWHRILDRFFEILSEGVHRFEGTVNQYTGDGIMALFGAPIAHEDHAQRACYAALRLREGLRGYTEELKRENAIVFSTRIGLHSGDVVVGKIGDDLRMDYTAQGHTVGLAQRMEGLAAPGTAYVTERTASMVSGFFALRDLGEFSVKGARDPLRVFELEGIGKLHTRLELSRARGFSRFVGRADEMATLESAFERARGGRPQVVGVVAEAGTGKSRLCFEFVERCRGQGFRVFEANALAHAKAIPFLPVKELLRNRFGIEDRDSDLTAREKIAGSLLLLDPSLADELPLLFEVAGVPDPDCPAPALDVEARETRILSLLKRAFRADAAQGVLILLIEDLHWLDPASEKFVAQMVEALAGTPALLLVNFRPEFHATWMSKSYYQQIALGPLGPDAVSELIGSLLGEDATMRRLTERIHARTDGNPFFTEEIVQSLIEDGSLEGARGAYRLVRPIESLPLPPTVNAVLAARIDRLPEEQKRVLQTAAVIGPQFPETLLGRASDLQARELSEALGSLCEAEFLHEVTFHPEIEYAFKHPTTQEVALGSQLAEVRSRVHRAVALALAEAEAERLDANAALLAHHWEGAGEPRKAARWHARAGEFYTRSDPEASAQHWRKVRALLGESLDETETRRIALRACIKILESGLDVGVTGDEAEALYTAGLVLADGLDERRSKVALTNAFAFTLGLSGDPAGQRELALAVLDDAEALEDDDLLVRTLHQTWWAEFCLGRLEDGRARSERLEALTRPRPRVGVIDGASMPAHAVMCRGLATAYLGDLYQGESLIREGRNLLPADPSPQDLGWVDFFLIHVAGLRRDPELSDRCASGVVRIAEQTASAWWRFASLFSLGWAHEANGRWAEACEAWEATSAQAHSRRVGLEAEPLFFARTSNAQLECGDIAVALATAQQAVGAARRLGSRNWGIDALCMLSRVLREAEGRAARSRAEEILEEGRVWLAESGARVYAPVIEEEHARWAALLGDDEGHRRHLHEAHRLYESNGANGHTERLAGGKPPT